MPLADVVTGLVTAIISGVAVWLWQRGKRVRGLRRTAAFFGLRAGRECLVVMNRHWRLPNAVARADVYALLDVGGLAEETGARVNVRSSDELREGAGERTEFCIGGPDSNARAAAHLAAFLPGAGFREYAEITAGEARFVRIPGEREHALVAKFTPPGASHPVFLICGQTAITNRAGIHFLRHHHRELARTLPAVDRFCLVLRVLSPSVYGHEQVSLEADVTSAAFSARLPSAVADPAGEIDQPST